MKLSRLKKNRLALERDLSTSCLRPYFTPASYCLHQTLTPRLRLHATGKLLDAGCGTKPLQSTLELYVTEYHSLDIHKKVQDIEYVADVADMKPIPSESFDTILCTEVLEHTDNPKRVLCEIWRVLKPGGKVILTVPFLSRLHEEPNDYFRFTKYGLTFLLNESGFFVMELVVTGSLFSFLGHQVSTAIVGSVWHVPVINRLVFFINTLLCTFPCYALDKLTRLSNKFPLGYVVVASKIDQIA